VNARSRRRLPQKRVIPVVKHNKSFEHLHVVELNFSVVHMPVVDEDLCAFRLLRSIFVVVVVVVKLVS